jgi:acyl-coenzyme A synthetase/AMP-(fatty) acid ligase
MTADDTSPPAVWSTIIDTRAREAPNKVFCEILEDDWRNKGSRKITYAQFAGAVNQVCWWLRKEFGLSKDFDSFTYVGDNDLRYTILMVAAQKSERTVSSKP